MDKNKKYGIVTTRGEVSALRKIGVKEENIRTIQQGSDLMNLIQLGDTLCVTSVKAFAVGAVDLFRKMQFLSGRGVDFSSANERFLNFTAVQPLSAVSLETLRSIAQREFDLIQYVQNCHLNANLHNQLVSRIQWESINDIVLVFRNKGVMKRGN